MNASHRVLTFVAALAFAGLSVGASAQTAPQVGLQPRCDPGLDAAVAAGIASRIADPAQAPADAPSIVTVPGGGGCVATLVADGATLQLGSVVDAESADAVASRAAFLVSSGWPHNVAAPEVDEEPAPIEVVDEEPALAQVEPVPADEPLGHPRTWSEGYARQRFVAVLTPNLMWPRPQTSPSVASFSLDLLGGGTDAIDGVQFSLLGSTTHDFVRGAQIGGLWTAVQGPLAGVQIGSGVAIAGGPVRGAQLAMVNVARDEVRGAQVGVVNYARGDVWVQYGNLNITRGRARVQVGALNVARDADVSIGAVTVVRDQPVYGNVTYNERGMLTLGLRHGSRIVQNLYEVGYHLGGERVLAFGYGIGATASPGPVLLQFDAVQSVLLRTEDTVTRYVGTMAELRASAGFELGRFAVYGGPTYSLYYTQGSDYDVPPRWAHDYQLTLPDRLYGWPGLRAGVRF